MDRSRKHAALSRRVAIRSLTAIGGSLALGAGSADTAYAASRKRGKDLLALAATFPIRDPAFNVRTLGRLQGDLSGRTIWSFTSGQVFGLVPGEGPPLADYGRLLYRVEGCSVKMSRLRSDGSTEERSRSWMFYKDADTGAYLSEFRNPYTGEVVPVPTFRGGISGSVMGVNGPQVSANFPMESTVFGRPLQLDWRFFGDQAWIYRHAFTRWLERATGVHKTEMTLDCWVCRIEDIANERLTMLPSTYSWTSQTEWQSWLKMRGKPGAMLWRTDGVKVTSVDQLPREFVEQSEKMLPGKLTEPLSWT